MRRFAAFLLALAFVSSAAVAGDGCPAGGGSKGGCPAGGGCPVGGGAGGGSSCPNACPLAQDAASHRSNGEEAVFASKAIRADYVKGLSKAIADL